VGIAVGWVTFRFGLFGLPMQVPSIDWLSYCGIIFILSSIIGFASLEIQPIKFNRDEDHTLTELINENKLLDENHIDTIQTKEENIINDAQNKFFRYIGIVGAIFAGICAGSVFDFIV